MPNIFDAFFASMVEGLRLILKPQDNDTVTNRTLVVFWLGFLKREVGNMCASNHSSDQNFYEKTPKFNF